MALEREGGDAYGFRHHSVRTREALVAAGVEIRDDAPIAWHVVTPAAFEPLPGLVNVLDTHWEMPDLAPLQIEQARKADLIVTASSWCARVFAENLMPDCPPIRVAPLGVDEDWQPIRRDPPRGRPFRFLWVGAPNLRKGLGVLADPDHGAWPLIAHEPDVELYLKTSFEIDLPEPVVRNGNVITDGRRLSRAELLELFRSADCFVFPTLGEGFGLTLAEAMCTGLPCVWTNYSGVTDFAAHAVAAKAGHAIPYQMTDVGVHEYEMRSQVAQAFPDVFAAGMLDVLRRPVVHLRRAEQAARQIRWRFTWERRAELIRGWLEGLAEERAVA